MLAGETKARAAELIREMKKIDNDIWKEKNTYMWSKLEEERSTDDGKHQKGKFTIAIKITIKIRIGTLPGKERDGKTTTT